MNPDSVTDVPGRIVLRGYQFRSLLWAAGGGVFLGLALFALVSDQPAIGALVFIAVAGVCCGIFLEAAVFNVLTVTDDQVDHRWWLGLRHKTVAIDSVRRIGSRIPPGRSAPSMRIEWAGGVIEFMPDLYDHRLVGRVLRRFIARGIPVEEMLYGYVRAFHPDELPPLPASSNAKPLH